MTIWLLNHYANSQYRDKSGRHYWFAKELSLRGHASVVFCSTFFHDTAKTMDIAGSPYAVQVDAETGVPFVFAKTRESIDNGLNRVLNMLDFFRHVQVAAMAYEKDNGKPDVIIASSVHPLTMVAGIRISRKLNVPCICEIRDLWPEAIFVYGKTSEKSLLGRALVAGEHWIYRNAEALIFTKEGDIDYLKEKGWTTDRGGKIPLEKCHYINNGIDLNVYQSRIHNDTLDDPDILDMTKYNIVYTGTIRPVNNIGNLLDCAKLLREYPDIQFLIYGDGSELEALRDRVKEERIDNVKLKGFVNRRHIPFILSKSSINLLNYSQAYNWTRGNSSNKLFEYMASGKPIISTVKMGYSILEKYECGLELDECTPRALAEAILRIRKMPKEKYDQMGQNALSGANDFDFAALTDKLEKALHAVIQTGNAAVSQNSDAHNTSKGSL